ncbi:branched-chain amino acid aminotransferase [Rhodopila sp.]|uniref:branched-chain amino acid aminotransferase n=1 Tax=Rhodopila sp. TaxID=2480087 RepID=UPI002CACC6F2|nr:branched-chain amino acid aminotransferase [Rhodopila sp.]HVZ06379.1 branched-chain amino acid aminotransferase [Rhodopila sp.]
MPDIAITRTAHPKTPPADDSLAFGKVFTDHMFLLNYDEGQGWHDPRIVPYGPFTLDPACCVLHYGQAIFDGLKAFRGADGQIRLFRLRDHARRVNRSGHYLCIPEIDPEMIEESIRKLVEVDQNWVPSKPGTALYIRPTVIATETFLGVHPSHSYLYYVIVGPVGAYYKEGMNPVRILATDKYVRAVQGGMGAAKTAGNYAASLFGAEQAAKEGYTQVLWLDGVHHKYLDEVGTMNIMLKIGDEVITPPLNGSILAGITRDSTLTLLRDWGLRVSERPVSIDEVIAAAKAEDLEMWGTGTAAVISPVGELGYKGERYVINGGRTGALTQKLYDTIVGIQYGTLPDKFGWTTTLGNRREG